MVFEALAGPFRLKTTVLKRLEDAMNVHVYTQPG